MLLAGIVSGGCGDDKMSPAETSKDQVTAVITSLGESARDGDGAKICNELFTSNLKISVAKASKKTCAREVGDNIFSSETSFDVKSVKVDGDTATATVTDQKDRTSDLVLFNESGGWRRPLAERGDGASCSATSLSRLSGLAVRLRGGRSRAT